MGFLTAAFLATFDGSFAFRVDFFCSWILLFNRESDLKLVSFLLVEEMVCLELVLDKNFESTSNCLMLVVEESTGWMSRGSLITETNPVCRVRGA